jgi:hypothetical protein
MKNVFHLEPVHSIMELDRTETSVLILIKKGLPRWNKFMEFLQKFWACQGTPDVMTPVKVLWVW